MVLNANQLSDPLLYFLAFFTSSINSIVAYTTVSTYNTTNKFASIINNVNELTTRDGAEWRSPYHPVVQIISWIVASLLSLETIIGNAMVIVAYKIEHSISKQVGNRFIVSLAVSDLIIGIEGIPLFTVYVVNGDRWPLGKIACETWLFLDYTLCLVSILTVLLITADRYLSVCHTARYLKWQNPLKIQLLIFFSWIIPAAIFGIMIYGWPIFSSSTNVNGENYNLNNLPRFSDETLIKENILKKQRIIIQKLSETNSNGECFAPFLSNPYVNMSMYVAYYWTTLIAMLILYKGIHKAAKKLEKKAKAKEHRHIALLLTQRLGTQVGVSLMLHSQKHEEKLANMMKSETKDSGYNTNTLSTTGISSYPVACNATESAGRNLDSRRSSSIFLQQTSHQQSTHSEQLLKDECFCNSNNNKNDNNNNTNNNKSENFKKNSVEEWQKPLRKRSATFAEGLNTTEHNWLNKRLNNFNQFNSWSQTTNETARTNSFFTIQNQRRKFPFFLQSSKTDEKRLRRYCTLPEVNKENLSSETFSMDEEEDDDFDDDDQLTVKLQKQNRKNQSNKKKLKNYSISYCIGKQMLLIGPPNTPDIEEQEANSSKAFINILNVDTNANLLYNLIEKHDNNEKKNDDLIEPKNSCNILNKFQPTDLTSLNKNQSNNKKIKRMCRANSIEQCEALLIDDQTKTNLPLTKSNYSIRECAKNRQMFNDNNAIENQCSNSITTNKNSIEFDGQQPSTSNTSYEKCLQNTTTQKFIPKKITTMNKEDDTLIQNDSKFNPIIKKENTKLKKKLIYHQQSMIVKFPENSQFNSPTESYKSLKFLPKKNFAASSMDTIKRYYQKTTSVNILASNLLLTSTKRDKWMKNMSGRVSEWMRQSLNQQQKQKRPNSNGDRASISFTSSTSSLSDEEITPKRCLKLRSSLTFNDLKNGCRSPKTSSVIFHKTVLNQSNPQKNINEIDFSNETNKLSQQQENQSKNKNKNKSSEVHLGINAQNTEISRKISSLTKNTGDRLIQSVFAPITAFNRIRKRTKAEKRAHKAFRTITFIVGLFAILWSPYYVVATIYGFCKGECVPSMLYDLSYYMCYLNSSGNPFAYALANRQFRSAFFRMFRGDFNRVS